MFANSKNRVANFMAGNNSNRRVNIIPNSAANLANTTIKAVNGATDAVTSVANGAAEAVANVAGEVVNVAKDAVNTVTEVANNTAEAVANTVGNSLFAIGNVAEKVNNSAKNALPENIVAPIQQSINAMPEGESMFSIPLIIGLGILAIAITLFVVFKDTIVSVFNTTWNTIEKYFKELTGPSVPSMPSVDSKQVAGAVDPTSQQLVEKVLAPKKEVFNISENRYTFADAEPLCKALGAELATYDQVKQAWNKGADWCNYGWVKGQAALYPTQQETFDKLQNEGTDSQRMACGQVGVNGGYFDNPELRFGVNCYGVKPAENKHSIANVMKNNDLPKTPEALEFDKKMLAYKAKAGEISINPFKKGDWSD
jgi:hypothetical protein